MILRVKNIHAGQLVVDLTSKFSCFINQGEAADLGAWLTSLTEVTENPTLVSQLSAGWLTILEYDAARTTPYFSTYP